MDEELTEMNEGKYPSDNNYKNKVLVPKIIEKLLGKEEILFFTNTDYFSLNDFQKAKEKGFKIIQINVGYKELQKRNSDRVKNKGYDDASVWLKGMVEYQKTIRETGLVDTTIDGKQSTLQIIKQLRNALKI
jgi:hypothetical protein